MQNDHCLLSLTSNSPGLVPVVEAGLHAHLGRGHDMVANILGWSREGLLVIVVQQPPERLGQRLAVRLHA